MISAVAIILASIAIFSYYSVISLYFGVIGSIITISTPFILFAVNYFQKSRIVLDVVKSPYFTAKGFDQTFTGYQLNALITNNGKKICFNLDDVSISIKDSKGNTPSLIKVTKKLKVTEREITLQDYHSRDIGYCWVDKKGDIITDIERLRQGDKYHLVYPFDLKSGIDSDKGTTFPYYSECLLELTQGEQYSVEMSLKGEDLDKNTVSKKKSFVVKIASIEFSTTREEEINLLKYQICSLRNEMNNRDSKIQRANENIEKRDAELKGLRNVIVKKDNDSKELDNRVKILSNELELANRQVEKLKNELAESLRCQEIYKKELESNPRVLVK